MYYVLKKKNSFLYLYFVLKKTVSTACTMYLRRKTAFSTCTLYGRRQFPLLVLCTYEEKQLPLLVLCTEEDSFHCLFLPSYARVLTKKNSFLYLYLVLKKKASSTRTVPQLKKKRKKKPALFPSALLIKYRHDCWGILCFVGETITNTGVGRNSCSAPCVAPLARDVCASTGAFNTPS